MDEPLGQQETTNGATFNTSKDLSNYQIVVIIPAFNEERFIGSAVLSLMKLHVKVIVIDDGSTDGTAIVAEAAGATTYRQNNNAGKGVALNIGFQKARELHPDAVVTIDADGQHLPDELPQLLEPILSQKADICIGSRYLEDTSNTPGYRRLGHKFFNMATSVPSGIFVSDSQSGFRAFSPKALAILHFSSSGFSVESEMQFLANENNLQVVEVPVTIRYMDKPKRSATLQGLGVLNGILRLAGQYRPLLFFTFPGFILLFAGFAWGVFVIERFRQVQELAVGYTLITLLLSIMGIILITTGITLHSIRSLLIDFNNHKNR